jgi:heat-inducible transcriptional repressor
MYSATRGLDERKSAILRAIVSHYVRSGEPVGSKTLVNRFKLGISAATARNEMGALEELGYLSQPHASAGRVPTDIGYRFYVDAWGGEVSLPLAEAQRVRRFFGEPRWELEDALRNTAALLSDLTRDAAVVFAPSLDRSVVRHVELISLAGGRAMLVLVTDTGRVENHVVWGPESVDEFQLDQASEMLNRIVVGVPLETAAAAISGAVERFPLELRGTVAAVAQVLDEEMTKNESDRVFLEGTSNIVDEQKFSDLETVQQVVRALEQRRSVLETLADAVATGSVNVRIGSENEAVEMQFCSVVTAPYGSEDQAIGSLAVIGPTRMDYRRTIAAVHEVSSNLGRMLSGLEI